MVTFRTAESVSPKHPDKLCDQISDAILDAYLAEDPTSRVAAEVAGGHGKVFVTGEVSSSAKVAVEPIVRRLAGDVAVEVRLALQSPEIAQGVNQGGAGDQGIMVGYACDETPELLPLELVLARSLNQFLYALWPYDGKTQVTLQDKRIIAVVASFQHAPHGDLKAAVRTWLKDNVYINSCGVICDADSVSLHVNPAGDWSIGGFEADAGLTGRKLVVDNYGPRIPIGGGCYSGKDPSKVDRSAAYFARKVARDYLTKYQAHEVYCRLAYAIGYDKPVEASVIVDGRTIPLEGHDASPRDIIKSLNLLQPQYEATARYGHFGHPDYSWEQADSLL